MAKVKLETAIIIDDKPVVQDPKILEVITKSGLDQTTAERYATGYAPMMREILDQAEILKSLDKTVSTDAGKAKRVSLDIGKICSRLEARKKEDKATLLIETRLIDGLFNVADSTGRLTQKDADEIVNYLPELEKKRLEGIATHRKVELEQYEAITTYLPLSSMTDDEYKRCLDDVKLSFNARKVEADKAEADRIEADQIAEEQRLEAIKKDAEEREAQRLENERLRKDNEEKEKQLSIEREAAAKESKRLADIAEAERKEQQLAIDTANAETARVQGELKAKQDAIDAELKAKEAAAKAALLAPDKVKVRQLYEDLKAISIPEFESEEAKYIGRTVTEAMKILLAGIINDSKKLV